MNLEAAKNQLSKLEREAAQMRAEIEERQGKLPIHEVQIAALQAEIAKAEAAATTEEPTTK